MMQQFCVLMLISLSFLLIPSGFLKNISEMENDDQNKSCFLPLYVILGIKM